MIANQDQCFGDCLQAMKEGAVLLHPRDADDKKFLYLRFTNGSKEKVPIAVWDRLLRHPQVMKELKGKWLVYTYRFEGDRP